MNNRLILAVPLLTGTMLIQAGLTTTSQLYAQKAAWEQPPPPSGMRQREAPPPEPVQPPPPPPVQAPPSPPLPPPPPPEYRDWRPMHYNMPMHYRMLEPEMVYGYQLMTPKERLDYMNRLHAARSFEERDRIRLEHHRLMQERARKRHMILPDMPGPGQGPGGGPGRWR